MYKPRLQCRGGLVNMNIYKTKNVNFKTQREWVQIIPPHFILRFTLEQEGPHGEWCEVNTATIAIDQEGDYDIAFKTKKFEKDFTKFILGETIEAISKF